MAVRRPASFRLCFGQSDLLLRERQERRILGVRSGQVGVKSLYLAAAGFRGGGKVGILVLDVHFSTARSQGFLAIELAPSE